MAEKTVVQVREDHALAIFAHCNWATAGTWPPERLQSKLKDVHEVAPEEAPEDEELAAVLAEVIEAGKAGAEFELISTSGDESGDEDEAEGDSPKADKPKKDKKPKKEKKPKEPRVPTPPKANRGRMYCVGVVLKEHGLDKPLNDLVKYVDEMYGKPNPKESRACLGWGWHVANGFSGTYAPPEEK